MMGWGEKEGRGGDMVYVCVLYYYYYYYYITNLLLLLNSNYSYYNHELKEGRGGRGVFDAVRGFPRLSSYE